VNEWLSWSPGAWRGFLRLAHLALAPPARRRLVPAVQPLEDQAIVGAVTGPVTVPRTLLLGRYDKGGRLRFAGRALAPLLAAAGGEHPWTGRTFSAGWGTRETLSVTLVRPELVVEAGGDVARDSAGRWRHPARWHRARPDLSPGDIELFVGGPPGRLPRSSRDLLFAANGITRERCTRSATSTRIRGEASARASKMHWRPPAEEGTGRRWRDPRKRPDHPCRPGPPRRDRTCPRRPPRSVVTGQPSRSCRNRAAHGLSRTSVMVGKNVPAALSSQ
jgi:hypothetical protein